MKNTNINPLDAEDLEAQVDKVLRGLGNPEPPLDLREVRELLKLDRHYYSSQDDSVLRERFSQLKIAGKQILRRPSLLLDVVRKAKISALWIPDRRRILIDEETPKLKHRWFEAHEIGHSLAPWHARYLFGDNKETLLPTCIETLEAEANFVAGKLLFLRQRFAQEAQDMTLSIDSVRELKKVFKNTLTSTLWRLVEEAHRGMPLVGIVSQHPLQPKADFNPETPCRYCIESPAFRDRFGHNTEKTLFAAIGRYCRLARGGPLGIGEVILTSRNGRRHVFSFESFSNTHEVLTLGVYLKPVEVAVALP